MLSVKNCNAFICPALGKFELLKQRTVKIEEAKKSAKSELKKKKIYEYKLFAYLNKC